MKSFWNYLNRFPQARIAYHYAPYSRWQYSTVEERVESVPYNHRDVLPNEIVLDIDAETKDECKKEAKKLSAILDKKGVFFSYWSTGNKGYHIHTFWKGLENVAENNLMKRLLFDWMIGDEKLHVDRQLLGKHLVRMEGGHHEKSLPKERFKTQIDADAHEHFKENTIPTEVFEEYEKQIVMFAVKKLSRKNKGITNITQTPECIKYLLSDQFSKHRDGGKRALFALASYYRKLPDEEYAELLKNFNRYNLRKPLPKLAILSTARSVRNHKGRHVGCRYRHDLLKEIGASEVVKLCEQQKLRVTEWKEQTINQKY